MVRNLIIKIIVNFIGQIEYHHMDIAIKYKIISKIINSNDESVLSSIKSLLKIDDEVDFWDELGEDDKAAINEGLGQLESGQYVSHESVREEIKNCFNFQG